MNYSDYWRVNKSYIDHKELTNALRGLRKVVGQIGVDVETVWSGVPTRFEDKIELPYQIARGEYPIPPDRMDFLVGLAIHEAMHIKDDTRHALGYLYQMFPKADMQENAHLKRLAECGEDIHVDGAAICKGIAGRYVQITRDWWRRSFVKDYTVGFPNADGLIGIWTDIVLDRIFPVLEPERLETLAEDVSKIQLADSVSIASIGPLVDLFCGNNKQASFSIYSLLVAMPGAYLEPLQQLLLKTPQIISSSSEGRALCYWELWRSLEKVFEEWDAHIELADMSDEKHGFTASETAFASEDQMPLPESIAAAIEAQLAAESADITDRIAAALRDAGGSHQQHLLFKTVVSDANDPCRTTPHKWLVRKLSETFRLLQERSARVNHGLPCGKVDSRRLYRVHTTGYVFKEKEYIRDIEPWGITLLLDASGSVRWHWHLIESIYAALVESLKVGEHKLEVLGYNEIIDPELAQTCLIRRLFHGDSLFTIEPSGGTPSGEAMITSALMMPPGNRWVMIHVTDGLWNEGIDVKHSLEFCKKKRIDVVTLGLGSATKALELQYGKNYELVESIEQLPRAVEAALRKKLLGAG